MQRMCVGKTTKLRGDDPLSILGLRGLGKFRTLQCCIGRRCLLVSHPEWQNGGTVVPPRDFQCGLAGMSVFIGIPP